MDSQEKKLTLSQQIRIMINPLMASTDRQNALSSIMNSSSRAELRVPKAISLLLGIDDKSLGDAAQSAMLQLLLEAKTGDQRDAIFRPILNHAFSTFYDQKSTHGGTPLIDKLQTLIEQNQDSLDYSYAAMLLQGIRFQRIDFNDPERERQAAQLIDKPIEFGGALSQRVLSEIGEDYQLEALLNKETPTSYLAETVKLLGKKSLSTISHQILLAHLIPIKYRKTERDRSLVDLCIVNLDKWIKDLPYDAGNPITLSHAERYQSIIQSQITSDGIVLADRDKLREDVLKLLATNYLVPEILIDVLIDPIRICDRAGILRILSRLPVTSNFMYRDQIELVCEFVEQRIGQLGNEFPVAETIDFLIAHLVGLSESSFQIEGDDEAVRVRKRALRYKIDIDQRLIASLEKIVTNPGLDSSFRKKAIIGLIQQMPNNLIAFLQENREEIISDPEVLRATIKTIGKNKYRPAFNFLKYIWDHRSQFEDETIILLIWGLGKLGNREILGAFSDAAAEKGAYQGLLKPGFLLLEAFKSDNKKFRDAARSALEVYQGELVREQARIDIQNTNRELERLSADLVNTQSKLNENLEKIFETQQKVNRTRFDHESVQREADVFLLQYKLDMFDVNLDACQLEEEMQVQMEKSVDLNERHKKVVRAIKKEADRIRGLQTELDGIIKAIKQEEKKINRLEKDISKENDKIEKRKRQLTELENQVKENTRQSERLQHDLDKRNREGAKIAISLAESSRRVTAIEKKVKSIPTNDSNNFKTTQRQLREAKAEYKQFKKRKSYNEKEVNALKRNIRSNDQQIDNARKSISRKKEENRTSQKNITKWDAEIDSLHNRIKQLEGEVEEKNARMNRINTELASYQEIQNRLRVSIETIKQEIRRIRTALEVVRERHKRVQSTGKRELNKYEDKLSSLLQVIRASHEKIKMRQSQHVAMERHLRETEQQIVTRNQDYVERKQAYVILGAECTDKTPKKEEQLKIESEAIQHEKVQQQIEKSKMEYSLHSAITRRNSWSREDLERIERIKNRMKN